MTKKLIVLLFCLISVVSFGQTTSVTATVTDSDGVAWGNLKWQIKFYPNLSQSNPCVYFLSGKSLCSPTWQNYLSQNGTGDSSGNLAFTTLDNSQISPSGSKWVITIQSNTTAPATQYSPISITGASSNLTSFLSTNATAPRFSALSIGSYGYSDIEVTAPVVVGNTYFNTANQVTRYWNGSVFVTLLNNLGSISWGGVQTFNPINAPYGTPSNVESAAHFISPTWNGYITPGITHNNQTYAIDIAGNGVEAPYVYSRPGLNRGQLTLNSVPSLQWTVHQWLSANIYNYSNGLSLGGPIMSHPGVGDTYPWYPSAWCHSTLLGPDDEGCAGLANHTTELPDFTGTVTNVGTVSTLGGVTLPIAMPQIQVNCTANCGFQGDGLAVIDLSRPLISTYATAWTGPSGFTPAQITINGTATISTAWGTLAADVAPSSGNPVGVGLVSETFTVNITSGCFTVNQPVWFADQLHDQGYITSVGTCTGTQSLTVLMRQPHHAGSWIIEGGTQGYGVFTAATTTINTGGFSGTNRYGVDILGATGAHTLLALIYGPASNLLNNPPGPIILGTFATGTNLTNNGTVGCSGVTCVNMTNTGWVARLNNASVITISGASDSAFNTQCTSVGISNGTTFCTISGLVGSHTSTTANIAIGDTPSGNGDIVIYPGGEVLDVQDNTSAVNTTVGQSNTFIPEISNTSWTNGDNIEVISYPGGLFDGFKTTIQTQNSLGFENNGIESKLVGPGAITVSNEGGELTGINFINGAFVADNLEPFSNYQYFGGLHTAPAAFNALGAFSQGLFLYYAPQYSGYGIYFGAPQTGLTDTQYQYLFAGMSCKAGVGGAACGLVAYPGQNLLQDNEPVKTNWGFGAIDHIVFADSFTGDVGSKINQAVSACQTNYLTPCTIYVAQSGTISTAPNLPMGYTLMFAPTGVFNLNTTWYIYHRGVAIYFNHAKFQDNIDSGAPAIFVGKNVNATVNISNASPSVVTWVSGTQFNNVDVGDQICWTGPTCGNIAAVTNTTLTLTTNVGSFTGVNANIGLIPNFGLDIPNTGSGPFLQDLDIVGNGSQSNINDIGVQVEGVAEATIRGLNVTDLFPGRCLLIAGSLVGHYYDVHCNVDGGGVQIDQNTVGPVITGSNSNIFFGLTLYGGGTSNWDGLGIFNNSGGNSVYGFYAEGNTFNHTANWVNGGGFLQIVDWERNTPASGIDFNINTTGGVIAGPAAFESNASVIGFNLSATSTDVLIKDLLLAGNFTNPIKTLAGSSLILKNVQNSSGSYSFAGTVTQEDTNGNYTVTSLTTNSLNPTDSGHCTMTAGVCTAINLSHSYTTGPFCVGNWTGTGTLTGLLKFPNTANTVTPTSSVNTDTAQVNWVCFGK